MSYDLLKPSFFGPPFAFFISASMQVVRLYREAAALTDRPWQDEGNALALPFVTPPQPTALVAYRRCSPQLFTPLIATPPHRCCRWGRSHTVVPSGYPHRSRWERRSIQDRISATPTHRPGCVPPLLRVNVRPLASCPPTLVAPVCRTATLSSPRRTARR
jgi:hypothetical protein